MRRTGKGVSCVTVLMMKEEMLTCIVCSDQHGDRCPHDDENNAGPASVVRRYATDDTEDEVADGLNNVEQEDHKHRKAPAPNHFPDLLFHLAVSA